MTGDSIWALSLTTAMAGTLVGVIFTLLTRVDHRLDKIEEVLVRIDSRLRALEPTPGEVT